MGQGCFTHSHADRMAAGMTHGWDEGSPPLLLLLAAGGDAQRVVIVGGGFGGLYAAIRLTSLFWPTNKRPQV